MTDDRKDDDREEPAIDIDRYRNRRITKEK